MAARLRNGKNCLSYLRRRRWPATTELPPPVPPVPSEFKPKGIIIGYALAHIRVAELDEAGNPVIRDGKPAEKEFCVLPPGDEVVLTTVSRRQQSQSPSGPS